MAEVKVEKEVIVKEITVKLSAEELGMIVTALGKQHFGYKLFNELDTVLKENGLKRYAE